MTHRPTVLVVAAALVDGDGRVLLARRPAGKAMAGLWEFPGGKVEPGETPDAAMARELAEELAITVDPAALDPITFASHAYETFHLLMPLYGCRRWSGVVAPRERQEIAWASAAELPRYRMPPADGPLIPSLTAYLAAGAHLASARASS